MFRTSNRGSKAKLGRILFTVCLSVVAAVCAPSGTPGGVGALTTRPTVFGGNGPETKDYVDHLKFSPDTSYFGNYACTGCPTGATLEFQPLDTTYKVNWTPILLPGQHKGSVVARVRNTSSVAFTDGTFTLQPYNDSHQDAYAWVGEAKLSNGTTWKGFGVFTLNQATGEVTGEWSLVLPNKILRCKNTQERSKPAIHKEHPGSDSDCHYLAQNNPSITTRLASLAFPEAHAATAHVARAALAGLGGLWISCSGGCCQVSTM